MKLHDLADAILKTRTVETRCDAAFKFADAMLRNGSSITDTAEATYRIVMRGNKAYRLNKDDAWRITAHAYAEQLAEREVATVLAQIAGGAK
ncbi:hypothetical protein NOH11_22090 [Escherichia coli]|uniref:hypothetical protein n=1 Tax=Enterobacterales TaxID=91347 RepID=UPI0002CCC407|nr:MULTISPECIES: hypothetical protein [Enterobacterales]ECV0411908.1 hypothetical protein [Salmonella enterica subsp. enterica serovar Montevideo]EDT6074298.1 hypothetical protein [Salmonella enterica subsp. enterica serovar Livingstone]EDW0215258.1 hypothetical protein [Salmonella enterica subsp. enterica]EEX2877785.1 hypothetical protein [Escherichia coli]EFC8772273.1 hypothetical protein [Escherichia coli]